MFWSDSRLPTKNNDKFRVNLRNLIRLIGSAFMLDTRKTSAESADPVRRGPSSLSPSECHPATHYTAKLNVGIISGSGYERSGELVTARELESRYKASARRRRSSTRAPGSRDYFDTRSKADTAASTTKVRSERDKGAPIVVLFFRCSFVVPHFRIAQGSSLPEQWEQFDGQTCEC